MKFFHCRNYAQLIANEVNPDENPREDAALVAAYCHLLDTDLGTEIYSTVVVNLSCMNHTNRIHLIDLAKQVKNKLSSRLTCSFAFRANKIRMHMQV